MNPDVYKLRGDNSATLSTALVAEIKKRFRSDQDNKFKLYLLSAGIREKYLNKEKNAYSPEFQKWFKDTKVETLFGSLSNFTRYAAAGHVIDYVSTKTSNPKKYLAQLPVSLRSLYEISKILKLDEDVFQVCFHFTPTRKIIGAPKSEWRTKNTTNLIHPHCSSVTLKSWRERWENPDITTEEDKYGRNVNLLSVKVSDEIFKFDDVGNAVGSVDIDAVQSLLRQIEDLFSKDNEKQFKLETKFDKISEKYNAERVKRDPLNVLKTSKKSRADDYK